MRSSALSPQRSPPLSPLRSPSFLSPVLSRANSADMFAFQFAPFFPCDPVPPVPPIPFTHEPEPVSPMLSPITSLNFSDLPPLPAAPAPVPVDTVPYAATQYKATAEVQGWGKYKDWPLAFKAQAKLLGIEENRNKKTEKPDRCLYMYANESSCESSSSSTSNRKGRKQAKTVKNSNWSSVQIWLSGKLVFSARNEAGALEAHQLFSQKLAKLAGPHARLTELKPSNIVVDGKFAVDELSYPELLSRCTTRGVQCYLTETRAPEIRMEFPNLGKVRLWKSGKFSIQGCQNSDHTHKVYLRVKAVVFNYPLP